MTTPFVLGIIFGLTLGIAAAVLVCHWLRPDCMRSLESELALCRARAERGVERPPGGYDGRGAVRT